MQSAYKKYHSTETALIRIQNDMLRAIDDKNLGCGFLVLLDLSAAFDTVDHQILLQRMSTRFGVKSSALAWIKSYLHERKQFVTISGVNSENKVLDCDVPQGSVLGPDFFGDYNSPLAQIFRRHGIHFQLYADDTQAYIFFRAKVNEDEARKKLEACLAEVRLWMAQNFLKLNDRKTDFMIFCKPSSVKNITTTSIRIGNYDIKPNKTVMNIGATLDENMKLHKQITKVSKSAWHSLFNISKTRKYMCANQCKTVIHAYVTSKIDNNNSLYIGLAKTTLLEKLSKIQHAAARLITHSTKRDDASPVLKQLHWLPVTERIEFKILLITYKVLNGMGPAYLKELLIPKVNTRDLRSSDRNELTESRSYSGWGDRSFSIAAPRLWNKLPLLIGKSESVDVYKSKLKTYLFKRAFCD